jgi:hypothetical protein
LTHRLIAKLGERSVEGTRHTIDVCLKSAVRLGGIFVFNVPPLPLAARKHGFTENKRVRP